MAIEIITEEVKMPPLDEQRYQYGKISSGRGKWEVIDTMNNNQVIFKRDYQSAAIAKHNLNKKFYKTKQQNKKYKPQ